MSATEKKLLVHDPDDLCTLRQAESEFGINVNTLRRWIYHGKGGRKLPTFRSRSDITTILVSRASVQAFQAKQEHRSRRLANGGLGLRLQEPDANDLRKLAQLMTARVGIPIAYSEALRSAVRSAIRMEESRAQGDGTRRNRGAGATSTTSA